MPSLSLCGRQWALASDDLPPLAFLGAVFHGVWLLLLVVFSVLAFSLQKPNDCQELAVFMSFLLFSTLVSTISDILILRNGLKGSILQPSHRRFAECVLYASMANFIAKIGIISYGTYLVFVSKPRCLRDTAELDKLMRAVIISTLVIAVLYLILFCVSYIAFPKNSVLQWKRRIRCANWCCCGDINRHESESLAKMALVFDGFFRPMDFSATDTLTSIFLASKRQGFLRNDYYREFEELPRTLPSLENIPSINGVRVGHRSLQKFFPPEIQMHSHRLSTVAENVEMDMLEQGKLEVPENDLTSYESTGQTTMTVELDSTNDEFDNEVANIRPTHQRQKAFDFTSLDLDALRFEASNHVAADEGPSQTIPTDDPPTPTDMISDVAVDSFQTRYSANHVEEEDDDDGLSIDTERSRSDVSVETTLSWCDDFTGPFLTPTAYGLSEAAKNAQTVEYDTLERMHLYHRYALAVYGALLYMASSKRMVDGLGRFVGLFLRAAPPNAIKIFTPKGKKRRRLPMASQRGASLRQRLNEEAILRYGFKKENILYQSHEDHLPYFVAIDYQDEAIVVAVRGTWSWPDLVTDFLIQPQSLSEEESVEVNQLLAKLRGLDPRRVDYLPEVSVHSGMLRSARGLIRNMQNAGMLEFLETGSFDKTVGAVGVTFPDIREWKFVMTGHSLGAGVVSLATLLLKSRFPNRKIECFAISPPGGTMSPELATAISPFCYSLVHGKDIIPRTNVQSIERLRDQMVRAATLCRRSKTQVLISGLYKFKWKEDELFFNPEQVDAEPLEAFRKYRAAVQKTNLENLKIAREFIPPGKIVFLRPTKASLPQSSSTEAESSATSRRDFEAVWISGKDLIQEGILLSLFMIKDHFPYSSIESLKDVMEHREQF